MKIGKTRSKFIICAHRKSNKKNTELNLDFGTVEYKKETRSGEHALFATLVSWYYLCHILHFMSKVAL